MIYFWEINDVVNEVCNVLASLREAGCGNEIVLLKLKVRFCLNQFCLGVCKLEH